MFFLEPTKHNIKHGKIEKKWAKKFCWFFHLRFVPLKPFKDQCFTNKEGEREDVHCPTEDVEETASFCKKRGS